MVYYTEESDAIDLTSKANVADERAKGKKRDVFSILQSKSTLKSKVGSGCPAVPDPPPGRQAVGEAGGVGHQVDGRQERLLALPGDGQRPPGQVRAGVALAAVVVSAAVLLVLASCLMLRPFSAFVCSSEHPQVLPLRAAVHGAGDGGRHIREDVALPGHPGQVRPATVTRDAPLQDGAAHLLRHPELLHQRPAAGGAHHQVGAPSLQLSASPPPVMSAPPLPSPLGSTTTGAT